MTFEEEMQQAEIDLGLLDKAEDCDGDQDFLRLVVSALCHSILALAAAVQNLEMTTRR